MVVRMKKTENYIQDTGVVILVTMTTLFTSNLPSVWLLLCGALMILLHIRSLTEHDKLVGVIQLLLTALLAAIGGTPVAFVTLGTCRVFQKAELVLPLAGYLIDGAVKGMDHIAQRIFFFLLLAAIILVLWGIEKLILSYFSALERNSHAMSRMAVDELIQKKLNRELTVKRYLAEQNARLEERESISRNIHNSVGHTITAAIMTLDAADMLFETDPNRAREKMNVANDRIRESLASIRHAVRVLDHESRFVFVEDLMEGLNGIADSFSMDTTIRILMDYADISPKLRLPHEHNEFLCGALQELLSNGVRHGGADHFTVSLSAYHGNVCLKVSDNGKSDFSEDNREVLIENGFGLKKLITYAERCGGSAEFFEDHGFRAVIKLPIYEEDRT